MFRSSFFLVRTTLFTLALLVLALGGCKRPISPAGASLDPLPVELYPHITVSPILQRVIVSDVSRIVWSAGTETTPASVAVPIRSLSDHIAHVQYRFLWFDVAGRQIGETGWRFSTLTPQIEQQFQGNSTSGDAQAWRMEIRTAR